ncbi:hypothetical protein L1N85_19785 [Paenibacillus alkaliterrae]|uniref:hypothetical protein n=1 Tax=Paenibacillus alkaliterrae TaxID=320909 RepID=UPI001F1D2C8F|nr:hypothetical protein [Paenibacillus alkaliterrae]MCF2940638.1 hypothetical protein [Paenibacillus alkaliterrae]
MVNANIQENERQFAPLLASVTALGLTVTERDEVVGNYRFMHEAAPGFAYKHIWTREYVYITEAGAVYSGQINLANWPMPVDSRSEHENEIDYNLEKGGLEDEI